MESRNHDGQYHIATAKLARKTLHLGNTRKEHATMTHDSGRFIYSSTELLHDDVAIVLAASSINAQDGSIEKCVTDGLDTLDYNQRFTLSDISVDTLRAAYKRAVLALHPDKVGQRNQQLGQEYQVQDEVMNYDIERAFDCLQASWARMRVWVNNGCNSDGNGYIRDLSDNMNEGNPTSNNSAIYSSGKFNAPIHEEVNIMEMDFEEDNRNDDDQDLGGGIYTHPCRCSGKYRLSAADADRNVEYVGCEQCSFAIRIIYDDLD